ncbi:MAG: peptidoglycan DD-metalloendopeptidase family protein [Anaerolineales bacterium]
MHLLLILLLVFSIHDVVPVDFPVALGRPLISLSSISTARGSNTAFEDVEEAESSRYLRARAVPFTSDVMRESLPMGEPEQKVRTSVFTYTVQEGDSVLSIAQEFNLEGDSILWANEELANNPDFLRLGQELNILPIDGAYHTVASGETVESIAKEYEVEPSAITGYAGNALEPSYELKQGDKLIIPGGVKPYEPQQVPQRQTTQRVTTPKDAQKGSGAFAWPMSGRITQKFWSGHQAIDIGAPQGTSIVAADAGHVVVSQDSNVGYGRMLIIDHGNGYETLYAHLSASFVEVGSSVSGGQLIGHCGSTGYSTGPHLHFEIMKNNVRQNPMVYLP